MSISKVYIELTDKCNLNCKMCYRRAWSEKPIDMDEKTLEKIYNDLQGKDIKEVVLGGIGEPTYSPLIKKALKMFSRYNLTLTTNGTILDEDIVNIIIESVNKIVVSIDGLEEKYKDIRGFELVNVLGNLNKIVEKKKKNNLEFPYIVIQFVASKGNIDDIFNVLDIAASLDAFQVIISNVIPQTEDYKDKILYKRYENKFIKDLFEKLNVYSFRKGLNLVLPNYELKTERYCPFIEEDAVVVGADGGVYPCYRFSHSINEYIFGREKKVLKYPFGNINEKSLDEIYFNTEYTNFRNRVYNNRYPSCLDCDLVDGCDIVKTSDYDCYTVKPSCADCLWSRRFAICP
ncbi:Cyclic pyranopterin monophosphate synthase [Caloramator mitchellensis]|uniref:Cyclic pyranopterin monophosphate synthase n=1 Tax=Caloramator mitchellensis TaxID=908809 RepID=A0A0R3JSF7_CALMK|nr:tungsten cofactor oxidoreductase radical SAM maturase [Caloramator mitchellensis]KRQ86425.1 Cyclic pyranopterin monophosphate synthase [Caloramator mitchellensis]